MPTNVRWVDGNKVAPDVCLEICPFVRSVRADSIARSQKDETQNSPGHFSSFLRGKKRVHFPQTHLVRVSYRQCIFEIQWRTRWVKAVGKNSLQCLWAGTVSSRYQIPAIKTALLPRNVAPDQNGAPSRVRSDEGALAPSCCAPQGHNQIQFFFQFFHFVVLF